MKICRYLPRDRASTPTPHFGLIEGQSVIEINGLPWAQWTRSAHASPLSDIRLLAPAEPSKIVCVGRNYAAHAAELGNELPKEPLIFLKPSSSLIGAGQSIHRPAIAERVDYEGELGVVIGRECRKVGDEEDPRGYILGYTC